MRGEGGTRVGAVAVGERAGAALREGGTRTGIKTVLEGVSCVCGRTSSFPAGERNQRLPGAGEVSMRHAGPRTPLKQISCVGGASQGRPKQYPFGSALTAPLKTFRFQRGPVLRRGKVRRGKDVLRTRSFLGRARAKKPPLKGEVPAKRAEGFRLPAPQGRGGSVSRRDHNQIYRRATALSGGTTYADAHKPNASRSSGERGLGGEALLSEKRPLPPASPSSVFSGGSAREGTFLQKSPLPRKTQSLNCCSFSIDERGRRR